MKIRIFSVLLLAAVCFTLFTGCSAVNALQQLDRAEEVIEHRLDVAEDKLERRIEAAVPKAQAPDPAPKVDTNAAAPAQAPAQPVQNRLTGEEGPDHDKHFSVRVRIGEKEYGEGSGSTKKAAEQEAAYHTLLMLKEEGVCLS